MKNIKNILGMNGTFFCFKYYWPMLVCVLFLSVNVLNAGNKIPEKENKLLVIGLVRDAHTKQPINAAQITLLNNNISATTNEKGVFHLNVPSENEILVVSAYDYGIRQVSIQTKDSVVIDLYSEVFSNYYNKIEGLTGLTDNLTFVPAGKSVTDFSKSQAVSPDELLQSELGGDVRAISRSGVAGEGASVFIRGFNSLNANAQPLYVVDGVIMNNLYDVKSIHEGFFSNPLNDIDVSDIESITVMKDGASIYGSKASNGVILIKTKRGKGLVTKINLNILTGITTQPSTTPLMNAGQFRTYASDLIGTSGLSNNQIANFSFLQDDPSKSTYNSYHNNTNWANNVYQTGMTQSYSINANGGDERALYYFSLGYTGITGVVKSTDMARINARFNADFNMSRLFTMGMNIGFTNIDRKLVDDGVNKYTSPTWLSMIKSPFLSPYSYTATGTKSSEIAYTDELGIGNPKAFVDQNVMNDALNSMSQHSFNFGATPTFHFTPNLTLSSQFDFSLNKTAENYYSPMLYAAKEMIDGVGYSENSRMNQVMRNTAIFDDTRLKYTKRFDKYNQIDAILGCRFLSNYYESDYIEGHNSGSNSSTDLPGSFDSKYFVVNGINNWTKSISNYLNVDYNYSNRYFLSLATSMDGSSRFGNETKGGFSLFGNSWGVFPSVNGAWLVSSEKFMKSVDFINHLKVRAGYGVTGNDNIEDYATKTYFSMVRENGNANGLILSNIANPQIQWETTYRKNAGVDLGLFNERVSLSFDYFSGVTQNLLTMKSQPVESGLGMYWSNEGELSNKGFEFSANFKVINYSSVKWELGLSVGHYENKILSLPLTNGTTDYTTSVYGGEVLTAVGQPAGMFYGYKTNGVYATEADAAKANLKILNQNGTYSYFKAGDVRFVDGDKSGNKDGIINANDKQIIGNPNPKMYGNITSKLSYKRLTLSTLFTYSYGNDVYNYQRSQLESGSDYSNQSTAMLSRWTAEGQVTNQPKAVYGDPMGNARFSDRWIEDGSYIRLKTLSLSYTVALKSNIIQGFSIWVSANNLLTLTKYLGSDPEFSTQNSVLYQGVDAGLVPLSKSYYLGLKINL